MSRKFLKPSPTTVNALANFYSDAHLYPLPHHTEKNGAVMAPFTIAIAAKLRREIRLSYRIVTL